MTKCEACHQPTPHIEMGSFELCRPCYAQSTQPAYLTHWKPA